MSNNNVSGISPIGASFPPDQYFYAAFNSYNPNYLIAQQQASLQAQQLAAAQQAEAAAQPQTVQGADTSGIAFQGKPQEEKSSATPWVIGGLTIAAGALALFAKHKGNGNITEGLKTICEGLKNSKVVDKVADNGAKAVEAAAEKGSQTAETVAQQGKKFTDRAKELAAATKRWLLQAKPAVTTNAIGGEVSAISTARNGYTVFLE